MGRFIIIDCDKLRKLLPNELEWSKLTLESLKLYGNILSKEESDTKFEEIYDKGFKDGMQGANIIHQEKQVRT